MDKLQLARDIDSEEEISVNDNLYQVKEYYVDFGVESGRLSCTCFDWRKHKLPCKHIMAIIVTKKGMPNLNLKIQ